MNDYIIENQYEAFDLDWKNPPKLADLKADVEGARGSHQEHINYVDHCEKIYKAKLAIKVPKGKSAIQPKMARKQAEWRYPSLEEPFLSTEDLFKCEPRTFEDKKAAEQNALILNYQFNTQLNKVKFINDYIRAGYQEGVIICKVGWHTKEQEVVVEKPVMGMVPVEDPEIAQQMINQGIPPYQEAIVDYELVKETVVVKNHPTVEVCNSKNVIIDPTCEGDTEQANFIEHIYESSLKDLKEDGRYKNLDKVGQSQSPLSDPDYHSSNSNSDFEFKDKARKKLLLHEYWGYWDIHGDGTVEAILAVYCDGVLIRLEENPHPDKGLPFIVVPYLPELNSLYGESEIGLIEDNQRVSGALIRGTLDLLGKSANSQRGIRKDALDIVNLKKYQRGEDYQFNPNVDPRQAIHTHTFPEIPRSVLELLQMQNNEAESLSGVKAFNSGISGSALGNTATGIRSAMDATSKRELSILRRLAKGITEIGRKFISMNRVFLQEEEVIRITNEEFARIPREDLHGDIDLRLNINTAESDNEKAQELSFMLQTIGNNVDTQITLGIMAEIAKLRKMPELAKRLEAYQPPPPDPIMVERAQLENEMIKAQIAYEYSRAEENQVDKVLKSAKARNLDSQSDMTDLDFLDKTTGKDLEREQARAKAASDAKIEEEAAKQLFDFNKTRSATLAGGNNNNI